MNHRLRALISGLLGVLTAASPALGAVYGAAEGAPSRIAITATAPAWMRVHDAGGNNVALRVLQAGDIYRVPDRAGLLIDTGNSKALKIAIDGVETPSIAKQGQSIVQRDIALDPDRFGPPAAKADPKPAIASAAPDSPPVSAAVPQLPDAPKPETVAMVEIKPVTTGSRPESPQPAPLAASVPTHSGSSSSDTATPARRLPTPTAPTWPDEHGIEIETSKGTVVQLHQPAATVFVSNPEIADVQVKSPTLIYIFGKSPGETSLYAADASDHVILNAPVRVIHNLSRLRAALIQLMPDEPIRADSIEGAIMLTGNVSSAAHAADAQAMAALFTAPAQGQGGAAQGQAGAPQAGAAAPAQGGSVINHLLVDAPNQVNLRVRVAEVARSTLRELGVNWNHTAGRGGNYTFQTENPTLVSNQTAENLLKIGLLGPASNPISAQIDAMAQEGLITTLAEPNLTAMSGQTASFLAGGEFPIPVQGSSGTAAGVPYAAITIEFKKYGVAVDFVPTILDSRLVSLRIKSEVSELTTQGAITQGAITIPGIKVRRAETSVELGSGDSFVIAGLLQNNGQHDISKLPALGDLPILGPLFRSDRFQRQETELVIIVTPVLVRPITTMAASPADGLTRPNDLDRTVTGAPYRQGLAKPGAADRSTDGRGLIGPAGFQLD